MRYYGPRAQTFGTLREAIEMEDCFCVLTDDGQYGTVIDWRELESGDQEELRELAELSEDEVEESMVKALHDLDEGMTRKQRELLLEDVSSTVIAWTTQGIEA